MDWNEIWKIVLSIIAGMGGIGAVILSVIKISSNLIAKRLEERYSLKLNKELESYKSKLENKNYISKTKFEAEFAIYRELSKVFFDAVKDISIMIPYGSSKKMADKGKRKEYEEKCYLAASKSVAIAQDSLNGNIPFISNELYEQYEKILALCRTQLNVFEDRWDLLYLAPQEEKEHISREDYKRTKEIKETFTTLNERVRGYLSTLDVLD